MPRGKAIDQKRIYKINKRFDEGLTNWQIAERTGIHHTTISHYRKQWKELNAKQRQPTKVCDNMHDM